ncbi:hypothetical protein [Streptomyces sp. NPDC044948]|uniref:hypothetical protein n=1 Tax=Streptomyces sp. NPDC044948 TaxID=3157092 RepID=UPI0033CE8BDE
MSSLDRDTLTEIAEKALTRPSDAMFWDDRLFTTHGAMFHWADNGDDILEESNYLSALALIQGAAGDFADDHVIDGSARHFAFGSLRTIYVQVYEGDVMRCRECDEIAAWAVSRKKHGRRRFLCDSHKDCWEWESERYGLPALAPIKYRPKFTAAFTEAAELAYGLLDYPIIDESDYSEREYERFQSNLNEALEYVQRDFEDDSEQESAAISERAYEGGLGELLGELPDACVDTDKVAAIYREARDAYFTELGNAHLNAPIAGQLALV